MPTRTTLAKWCSAFILLISTTWAFPLSAQSPPHLRFQHLTVKEGLAHNSVYAMLQDRQGFMWFGTFVGLCRYNGYAFTVYKHDPEDPHSLSHNAVVAVHEDRDGDLWIGTNGGLNRYDRQYDRFIRYLHEPDNPHSLIHSKIEIGGLAEDRQGNLWISTHEGLELFDKNTGHFIHQNSNPLIPEELRDFAIQSIYEDRQGTYWFAVAKAGAYRVAPESGQLVHYVHNPADPATISSNNIRSFFEDQAGTLWIGTWDNGLNRFDADTGQFNRYTHQPDEASSLSGNTILGFAEDFKGRFWIGTAAHGLNMFVPESGEFWRYQSDPADPVSLNDNRIRSVYYAPSGVLWIGTKTGGVNLIHRNGERFAHYKAEPKNPEGLSDNVIFSIYADRSGTIWIGTDKGGLNRFDPESGTFTRYQHDPHDPDSLPDERIWAIYEDQTGALWIGTSRQILRFDPAIEQLTGFPTEVELSAWGKGTKFLAFAEDRQRRLWIGSEEGLYQVDKATGRARVYRHIPDDPESLSHNQVNVLYEDRTGAFWVGTQGGLNRFDRETGKAQRYLHDPSNPQSVSNNDIRCLYEDRSGRFWIGTAQGLNLFDRATGIVIRCYREKDGLPNETIYGILEDSTSLDARGGNLWMSTNMGLTRFNPERETFTNYDERDGLQGNEFNRSAYCQTRDGLMLFGGFNGLNAFYPEQIKDNPYVPPVVLTDFRLFQQPVPIGKESVLQQTIEMTDHLTLSYKDAIFSFEFAALNYILPEKNRYRYRMEGFENTWNEITGDRRFVTYTNLDPGEYVFRVQGANNDGVWNEAGVSLALTITPPWWERWWFRGLLVLLVLAVLAAGYQMRIQALQRREKNLEQQVDLHTRELQAEIEVRKNTEQALRESEERFRSIVETTPSMLSITNQHGETLYISPNCKDFLGYSQDELQGKLWWWVHEDDTPRARKVLDQTLTEKKGGRNFEYKGIKKSGEIWYASSSWDPLYDQDATFLGVVMQTLDITDRKHAERELQRLYEQTRRDAETKAELLREVNHRVGNNLMAISGMLSLELRYLKQHKQISYQELMQDLTNRINGLARVHDMLSASEWSPLPVDELIERVVHSSLQIVPPETHVTVEIIPSNMRVNADQAHHLALVFNELATNTAKYAIQDRVFARIVIEIARENGWLRIRFQDDGPGYPDDVLNLQRQNVGLDLIRQLMERSLHGEWQLRNNEGAVTILRFPVQECEGVL